MTDRDPSCPPVRSTSQACTVSSADPNQILYGPDGALSPSISAKRAEDLARAERRRRARIKEIEAKEAFLQRIRDDPAPLVRVSPAIEAMKRHWGSRLSHPLPGAAEHEAHDPTTPRVLSRSARKRTEKTPRKEAHDRSTSTRRDRHIRQRT